jgi:hypothetical protein
MKFMRLYKFFLPVLIFSFAFMSCNVDENPIHSLEQVIERIPNVQSIQGAENATLNVRNDKNRSYFNITIDNTSHLNGVYNAWCVQMDVSLQTEAEYSATKLYETDKDRVFNKLSYIINNRKAYESELHGLTWKEIQVAFWVILETQDYNITTLEDRIPGDVEGFNSIYVNSILNDVKTHGSDFVPGATDTRLIYYEIQDNQNGVIEQTAWAWAANNSDSFRYLQIGQQWGWIIYYDFETLLGGLYAGCGFGTAVNPDPSDLNNCVYVGSVSFSDDDVNLSIVVGTINNWYMTNVQVYVGDVLPSNLAPGGFPHKNEGIYSQSETFTIPLSTFETGDPTTLPERLYIAVHADVETG